MRSLKIGNSPRYLASPRARGFTLLASVIGRSIYRRNTAYSELVRTVSASGAEVARAPATRRRPVATRVEFPRARLVPAPAFFAGPTARLHAVADVHGVWRRAGGPARQRCRELRALAPRNDGAVIEIKRRAAALGFAATGIARLDRNPHAEQLDRWLADGHAGTMTYLHRQAEQRKDPRRIMPGARAAVVTLTNYFHGSADPGATPRGPRGRVAQYAWSPDYHDVLGERLEQLATAIRELLPGATTRCYVDAGPVPERELAQLAGLGWIGKNMMLIHPEIGSFTFIGIVLTDAELAPDLPFEADRCGTCTRCLEACPTQAFVGPRDPSFAPRADVAAPDVGALATMNETEFDRRYGDTPFTRPGLEGMRRNALVD